MPEETALALVDAEQQQKWQKMADVIKAASRQRRRDRTPKSKIKSKPGGEGKSYPYVDRPDYQIWLDDHFPGWSTEGFRCWTDSASKTDSAAAGITPASQTVPVLFNVSFTLVVVDSGFAKRHIPCVGSAPVSIKEFRDSSTLLKNKYNTAITEAFKVGCGWLGAFFDLRADDEAREEAASPITKAQGDKFVLLLADIKPENKNRWVDAWEKQNKISAEKFLKDMEEGINKAKQQAQKVEVV
jgi:hypothetical protein